MKLFTKQQADTMKKDIREFLSQMHEKWIYHRDLWGSLRNIMICPDGKIYIIDFWKAIKKEGVTDEKEVYGHDQYYSDEEILDIIDAYTEED
jgi:serine/threonine protein kinase